MKVNLLAQILIKWIVLATDSFTRRLGRKYAKKSYSDAPSKHKATKAASLRARNQAAITVKCCVRSNPVEQSQTFNSSTRA
jgi:hypothetical protein